MDKLNTLSMGEKLVVGGGILLFIAGFLPWYSIDLGPIGDFTRNGWQSPGAIWSFLAIIIGLVMAGSILAAKFGNVALPALGTFSYGQAYLAGGALVILLLLIKLINESSYMSFGFFLGILCGIALAAGGYLIYSEDKGSGFNFNKS